MTATAQVDAQKVEAKLKLCFAVLSCLGGLALAAGDNTESIMIVAIFFAVFGFVFVDWLRLFALPPIAAYIAMGLAALYCVSDFTDLNSANNRQMLAFAQLLVFVEAILMLQKKTRRIFEQLAVFCLLELVVAAVFNNALTYGMILIPISLIGACALSLLATVATWDGLSGSTFLTADGEQKESESQMIQTVSPESVAAVAHIAKRLPRITVFTLAPAVFAIAFIFFYGLPRVTDAAKMNAGSGQTLVGFSDQIRLNQIGQMLQNNETALRIRLRNPQDGKPYPTVGGLYLRGRVLEVYRSQDLTTQYSGTWSSHHVEDSVPLPSVFIPERSTDENFFDTVDVDITCEPMRGDLRGVSSLFAIAPYHQKQFKPDIKHAPRHWTVSRGTRDGWIQDRIQYSFRTHGFRDGIQTNLLCKEYPREYYRKSAAERAREDREYRRVVLQFDPDRLSNTEALALSVVRKIPAHRRDRYQVARRLESFLAFDTQFSYTLNLDAQPIPGMDPVEQFLVHDKKGHCQYFASALALMLRSQGIPARIVVGYRTDEYHEISNQFVARQLHAHAWVEALIPREELPPTQTPYGQPRTSEYWLRLDPTPGRAAGDQSASRIDQALHLTQSLWDDYVVEMNSNRQQDAVLGTGGAAPYSSFVQELSIRLNRIRAGELGGGSLAGGEHFSWPAAILGIALTLIVVVLLRAKLPQWVRLRTSGADAVSHLPSIQFYARALEILEQLDVFRRPHQTPLELLVHLDQDLQHPQKNGIMKSFRVLTDAYYLHRFCQSSGESNQSQIEQALADLESKATSPMIESQAGVSH